MNEGEREIAAWLEGLGMADYAERFAENRIDFSVLPELSDEDLKELGVVLGDRRSYCARSGSCPPDRRPRNGRPPSPRRSPTPQSAAS
jgi:hypothetical protein